MLRNFDLPEALVFYGTESCVDAAGTLRPGVARLLREADEVGCGALLLSESHTPERLAFLTRDAPSLRLRSAVGSAGRCPSPGALLDATASVTIEPRGFGGSAGFGTKQADPTRSPLPQHVVVFVAGPTPHSRARCSAARMAGMRVVYVVEQGALCDADDLADGVVEGLGDADDWEMLTLDDVATPGSFWLPPPSPRDDEGNRVSPEDMVSYFERERQSHHPSAGHDATAQDADDETAALTDEEELERILADLDTL